MLTGHYWPFVGRDAEADAITAAFADAGTHAVVISGVAGVGKTALAREALARLGAAGCRTRWVAGTRAGASVPFGAVAHLVPPEWQPADGPLGVLRSVASQVGSWGGRGRVAIGVDDAHLLDDSSAAVVAHLVVGGLAFALLTVRAGEPVADAVKALWKEGHALRLDLAGLSTAAVDQLLDHSLDGGLDGLSRHRMHEAAAGNPLALRELLHAVVAGGGLTRRYGIWRLDPGHQLPGRVTELIAHHLVGLDTGVRQVVEVVAGSEPVALPLLERIADPSAVRAAEESGLVVVERSGARAFAGLAHPLYGEVLRAGMSPIRTRQVWRELAHAALAMPMRRRDDALHIAQWQVDGGAVTRPEVVLTGARQAIGWSDLALAERLARAARDAQPGGEADRLLAEILEYRGKSSEAAALVGEAPPPDSTDRVRWAVTRADTLYWGTGDVAGAEQVLDSVAGEDGDELADGSRSWILFFAGRCADAFAAAQRVLARSDVDPQATVWAAAGGTASAAFLGSLAEADAIHRRGLAVARSVSDSMPWGLFEIGLSACLGYCGAGELLRARTFADQGYAAAVDAGVPMMVSGWALFGGLVALAQGHVDRADVLLREAIAGFEENDTFRFRRCNAAAIAGVAALRGEAETAARLLDEVDRTAAGPNQVFTAWIELWRAWTLLAQGQPDAAVDTAHRAAGLARSAGLSTVETSALYDVARLGGRPDRDRLRALAAGLDTPCAWALVEAADALDDGDAGALSAAATALHNLGHDLLAAEAATAAAKAFDVAGQRGRASLARAAATAFGDPCKGARTPLLGDDDTAEALTPREYEILLLAVEHSSRQVAERLGLAVATINNHLARAYAKLGVSSRAEVRALLEPEQDER